MPEPRRAEVTVTKSSCWGVQEPPCLRATIFFLSLSLSPPHPPPRDSPTRSLNSEGGKGLHPNCRVDPDGEKGQLSTGVRSHDGDSE